MFQKELGALEAFRQLLPDGLFNDPGACKTDKGVGLCKDDIPQHGKACRNAARCGIRKHADKQLPGLMMTL